MALALIPACDEGNPGAGQTTTQVGAGGPDGGGVLADGEALDGGGLASDTAELHDVGVASDAASDAALDAGPDGAAGDAADTSTSGDAGSDSLTPDVQSPPPLPEQSGAWPSKEVVLRDGAKWAPIRFIADGKGGQIKLNNLPPLLKPKRTRYSPTRDQPGLLSIIFREGQGVVAKDGQFISTSGADLTGLAKVEGLFGPWLGPIARSFPGDKATLDAERLKLEQNTGRALRDRATFFTRVVHSGADVGVVADALNALPVVELAAPVARPPAGGVVAKTGTSTVHDTGPTTRDLTLLQTHLLTATVAPASAGGHGVTYAWSLPGGRGEGTHSGQTEYHWNRQHEDMDNATTILESSWGGVSSQQNGVNHDMGCAGIYKARNDAIGVTGICSESVFHQAPTSNVDQLSTWAGAVPTWLWGSSWTWSFSQVLRHLASTLPAGSAVSASLQTGGPNSGRRCAASNNAGTPSADCTPRVQCLPAPPYASEAAGGTRMRCEGYPYLDAASNGCPAPQTCQARWGFGARCLPVPLPELSIFGFTPAT